MEKEIDKGSGWTPEQLNEKKRLLEEIEVVEASVSTRNATLTSLRSAISKLEGFLHEGQDANQSIAKKLADLESTLKSKRNQNVK